MSQKRKLVKYDFGGFRGGRLIVAIWFLLVALAVRLGIQDLLASGVVLKYTKVAIENSTTCRCYLTKNTQRTSTTKIRSLMSRLNIIGGCVAAWGILLPYPYTIVIVTLTVAPIAALSLLVKLSPVVEFGERRGSKAISAFALYIYPGLALAVRALIDIKVLDWQVPLLLSLICGALLGFTISKYDARLTKVELIIVALASVGISWGALMEANTLMDTRPPNDQMVTVRDRTVTHGKGTSYVLTVDPWGTFQTPQREKVTDDFYASTKVGDKICIRTHPGFLGWKWYELNLCRQS